MSASVHTGIPPPGADTPLGAGTPTWSRHPPRSRHPPWSRPLLGADTPLWHMVNEWPVRILLECILVTAHNKSWGKVIFSEACVNNSVHGGACMVALGGMRGCTGRGHAWLHQGACVVLFGGHAWFYLGGMRGFIQGACMDFIGGCVWFYSRGVCGFYSGGHAWFYSGEVCMVFSVFSDTMRYGQ